MSDSGMETGNCKHNRDPLHCIPCLHGWIIELQTDLVQMGELLARFCTDSDTFKYGQEVERAECARIADTWGGSGFDNEIAFLIRKRGNNDRPVRSDP